jgi:hypothetical protein
VTPWPQPWRVILVGRVPGGHPDIEKELSRHAWRWYARWKARVLNLDYSDGTSLYYTVRRVGYDPQAPRSDDV